MDPAAFPIERLNAYDNLDAVGDDGWSVARLEAAIAVSGRIKPLEVAHSAAQLAEGDDAIYVFNGHHRLQAALNLGITHVPVVTCWRADDAVPVAGIPDEFGDVVEID